MGGIEKIAATKCANSCPQYFIRQFKMYTNTMSENVIKSLYDDFRAARLIVFMGNGQNVDRNDLYYNGGEVMGEEPAPSIMPTNVTLTDIVDSTSDDACSCSVLNNVQEEIVEIEEDMSKATED